jgi:hypothetical protein
MHPSSLRSFLLVLACALFGLSAGQGPRGVRHGRVDGLWELSQGVVLGTLDTFQGGGRPLALQAMLFPFPVMCPACWVGQIAGTLDDGIGVGPDFLEEGGYAGDLATGAFAANLRLPDGTPAGSMRGRIQASWSGPGSFAGRYALRR